MISRETLNRRVLVIAALPVNVLLSLWIIWTTPLVNTDAILYLLASESIIDNGLSTAFEIYQWPFLPLLLAALNQLTGIPLLLGAYGIMTLCFTLIFIGFCRIITDLGGGRRTLYFAFAVISCHAVVNEFRGSIIRDPGMLAFLLLALSEHLRFAKSPRWRHAIGWGACITIAFLFRVEVLAIAVLAPVVTLLANRKIAPLRYRYAARLYTVPLAAAGAAALSVVVLWGGDPGHYKVVKDVGFMASSAGGLVSGASAPVAVIADQVLETFSREDAFAAFVAAMLAIFAVNLVRAITLPYLLALAAGRWQFDTAMDRAALRTVKSYGWIVAAYLVAFTLFAHFNLTRYCLQLGLLVLFPLPFMFARWWQSDRRQGALRAVIVFILAANALDGLVNSDWKKGYIREAASWAKQSPAIAPEKLVTNDPYIAYFSEKLNTEAVLRVINPERLTYGEKTDTHWLAGYSYAQRVRQGTREKLLLQDIRKGEGEVLHVFEGADKHTVYVFTVGGDIPRAPQLIGSF